MELLTKKVVAARKEFIAKASLCEFNFLWKCKHPMNGGRKCASICEHYINPKG